MTFCPTTPAINVKITPKILTLCKCPNFIFPSSHSGNLVTIFYYYRDNPQYHWRQIVLRGKIREDVFRFGVVWAPFKGLARGGVRFLFYSFPSELMQMSWWCSPPAIFVLMSWLLGSKYSESSLWYWDLSVYHYSWEMIYLRFANI